LVLHPTRTASAPASIAGAPYELIHFGLDESAIPQLTGWWIPAPPNARYAQSTILFLPTGDGSLTNSVTTLTALHNLGINVFAFDYRGYGQSADTHPSQEKMTQDANHAWQYLNTSRNIPAHQIIPYGSGVGSSLAPTPTPLLSSSTPLRLTSSTTPFATRVPHFSPPGSSSTSASPSPTSSPASAPPSSSSRPARPPTRPSALPLTPNSPSTSRPPPIPSTAPPSP